MTRSGRLLAAATVLLATGGLLPGTGVIGGAAPAAAATCPAPGGVTVPEAAAPSAEVVVLGHGFGHAVGMSQYGAEGAARLGCSHDTILRTYYRGASVASRTMPPEVRLWMLRDGTTSDTLAETGAVTWLHLGAGCASRCGAVQPRGTTWQVRFFEGRFALYDVNGGATPWRWVGASAAGTLTARHSGVVVTVSTHGGSFTAARRMRWDETRYTAPAPGRLQAVQALTASTVAGTTRTALDKYLWGLGEVPASWPFEALRAQVVAARTYAARRLGTSTTTVLFPTTQDQYYRGYSKELEDAQGHYRWPEAVTTTTGRVVVAPDGSLAQTMYSSSGGGATEDARYVFGGTTATPYLTAVDDSRWDTASSNPYRSWSAGFSRAQVAAALGFSRVDTVTVAPRRTDGRWRDLVVVTGLVGTTPTTRHVAGNTFRNALGLRSPGFTIRMGIGGAGAQPVVGDWDGDGDTDLGWFRAGTFSLRMGDGSTRTFRFGAAGDIAVAGDWDGDGTDGIGVWHRGIWYARNALSTGAYDKAWFFGSTGDTPVVGDWDGDGVEGVGVFRGGRWSVRPTATSGPATAAFGWGASTDTPVVGDWDGNGTETIGVRRSAAFYLRNSVGYGPVDSAYTYVSRTYPAVAGDWDGNGTATAGIAAGTTWWLRATNAPTSASTTLTYPG